MEAPSLKFPHRRAAPARTPPAGGPAMMNAVERLEKRREAVVKELEKRERD
jgi:hypothetical protein